MVYDLITRISRFTLDLNAASFKICDFGLSEQRTYLIDTIRRSRSSHGAQVVGTAIYRAPELFFNTRTGAKVTVAFSNG